MPLVETKFEIPAPAADAANDVLLELGEPAWSVLEDVVARRAWVVGIFDTEVWAQTRTAALLPIMEQAAVARLEEPTYRLLTDTDWRDSYKTHFHAWQFGRLHWVPVWERPTFDLPPGHAVLWLDPGLAFGTGNHETTRLCVERLAALAERLPDLPGLRMVDAGCGSGILALSAALLGFRIISGFDSDPEAVRISAENADLNGLAGRVSFFVADLVTGLHGKDGSVDVLLANIQADVLMRFARELVHAIAPGGWLVLSGILALERATVHATFAALVPGWIIESRDMGEWSDLQLSRPV